MIKKSLYPKTKRVKEKSVTYITEKMDGSNLGFFNYGGELLIATRKNIYKLSELEECKSMMYKGLYQWLLDNGEDLLSKLCIDSGIFGEWQGMGQMKYNETEWESKFAMFAKARIINDDLEVRNIIYSPSLIHYAFLDGEFPTYIGRVPLVTMTTEVVNKAFLDILYESYSKTTERENVEGFIIIRNDYDIEKYVRRKRKVLIEHFE